MADEKKKGYPKIPLNNWFLLRDKFKQRAPEKVSPSYVATALSMGEASAKANIIPPLKVFGLIDDSGKPTDLAYDWRDNDKYSQVCTTIVQNVYPQELRDLFHDVNVDFKAVERWFARDAKVGESAARSYAATYLMLLEGDLSRAKEQGSKAKTAASTQARPTKASGKEVSKASSQKSQPVAAQAPAPVSTATIHAAGTGDGGQGARGFSPKLHVDIQIHISPDCSPDQIDKIFESMAKHLPFKS